MASYLASFIPAKEGGYVCVFIDFPTVVSQGETLEEAIEMAEDLMSICAEEYTIERKQLPQPSSFERVKELTSIELEKDKETIDFEREPFYQLIKLPNMETKPVRISVSIPKNVLEFVDKEADKLGMTRSGFLAKSAMSYSASQ